jgi:hypothetical protein
VSISVPAHADRPLAPVIALPAGLPLRALGGGALLVALLTLGVVAAMPESALAAAERGFAWLGAGAAVLAGGLASLQHARLLQKQHDPRFASMQLQAGLGLGFGAKLLGLALGASALVVADVKFAGVRAFALAFVAASLVLQLVVTSAFVRALSRARAAQAAAAPRPAAAAETPSSNVPTT